LHTRTTFYLLSLKKGGLCQTTVSGLFFVFQYGGQNVEALVNKMFKPWKTKCRSLVEKLFKPCRQNVEALSTKCRRIGKQNVLALEDKMF
jgi:hypothetical protein